MTIPRIGDKIVRVKAQMPDNTMEQIVPNEQPPVIENTSEFEDASLDDMFDSGEEYSEETENNNTETEQESPQPEETPAPVINNRHPEDSYSIEKFTNDYLEKLHKDVLPMLTQYDPERKQRMILAILCGAVCWVAALLVFFLVDGNTGNIVGGLIALGGFIWYTIKKQFEKKIKRTVMPVLMKAVPDFYWQLEPPISEDDIIDSKIFPLAKESTKTYDDAFLGKYRGVEISISECNLNANKRNVFSGAIIRIRMNKDFEGITVIRPKKEIEVKDVKDLKKLRYNKVELEDIEFNKTYDVYSTDQVEARYLLTTAFMERFKNINMAFDTKVAYCSFYGKYVYIAPYCKKDLFSICSLIKNVDDEKQFVKLFNEFTSILALVDHFKLDKKLGL